MIPQTLNASLHFQFWTELNSDHQGILSNLPDLLIVDVNVITEVSVGHTEIQRKKEVSYLNWISYFFKGISKSTENCLMFLTVHMIITRSTSQQLF